jgi:hypothetical protein
MARQRKTLPARRQSSIDDSLLIRSAESLGRMIGSLQRQLDAARALTQRADGAEMRGNGHARVRQRSGQNAAEKAGKKAAGTVKRTAKATAAKKAGLGGAAKRRPAKTATRR